MSDHLERHRRELLRLRDQLAQQDELIKRRTIAVREAREAGMTVREAAALLDMTETGLWKAQRRSASTSHK